MVRTERGKMPRTFARPGSTTPRPSPRCDGHGRMRSTSCRSSTQTGSGSTSPGTCRARSWRSASRSRSMRAIGRSPTPGRRPGRTAGGQPSRRSSSARSVEDARPRSSVASPLTCSPPSMRWLETSCRAASAGGSVPSTPSTTLLAADLGPLDPPYAWYIRIPDAARLLRALSPVIDARLAASALAGYDGTLDHRSLGRDAAARHLRRGMSSPSPRHHLGRRTAKRGDAAIPPLLLAQLVLGYRTVEELRATYPDVWRCGRGGRAARRPLPATAGLAADPRLSASEHAVSPRRGRAATRAAACRAATSKALSRYQ